MKPVYTWEFPFIDGAEILLTDATGEGDGPDEPWVLNRGRLITGLHLLAEKYPKHFNDFVTENEDADTGDIYLQLCLFGEVVFG
jgi:hypothetical protein